MGKSTSQPSAADYNINCGHFQTELYAEVPQEALGEDIGQNSSRTAKEQDEF